MVETKWWKQNGGTEIVRINGGKNGGYLKLSVFSGEFQKVLYSAGLSDGHYDLVCVYMLDGLFTKKKYILLIQFI